MASQERSILNIKKECLIHDLSDPILSHVLSYVGKIWLKQVCKKWRNLVFVIHCPYVGKCNVMKRRMRLKSLKNMIVDDLYLQYNVTEIGIDDMILLRDIIVVTLYMEQCCGLTEEMLLMLTGMKCTKLILEEFENISHKMGNAISGMVDLRSVVIKNSINNCDFKEMILGLNKGVNRIGNLRELDLECCTGITDDVLKMISECEWMQNLEELKLMSCNNITDEGIKWLIKCENLRTLNVSFCNNITDEGIKWLKKCINLRKLDASHCNKIKGATLELLCGLLEVNFYGCNIFDVSNLKNIKSLDSLCVSNVNQENVNIIEDMVNLKQLYIMCNGVVNITLHRMTKLEDLTIYNCRVTLCDSNTFDCKLVNMKLINMFNCNFLARDFEMLNNMKSIEFMLVRTCVFLVQLDDSELDEYKNKFNQLEIIKNIIIKSYSIKCVNDLTNLKFYEYKYEYE